jgi:hypothetical protein
MVTDPETTIRLNDAKADAKIRQLTNKVEFLKSELDAEKQSTIESKKIIEFYKVIV